MTNKEFAYELVRNYYLFAGEDFRLSLKSLPIVVKGRKKERVQQIILILFDKISELKIECCMDELPRKIKLNVSIKRKYIVSVFAELGLKVIRYTREYGKTIVYFESISDSP